MSESDVGMGEREVDQGLAILRGDQDRHPRASVGKGPDMATGRSGSPERSVDDTAIPDRSVSIGQLQAELFHSVRAGMALKQDIYEESGVLLLAAGCMITSRFLKLLRDRNITRVQLRSPVLPVASASIELPETEYPPDVDQDDRTHTTHSVELDKRMGEILRQPIEFHSVRTWRRPRLSIEELKNSADQGMESHRETSAAVANFCETLDTGRRVTSAALRSTVDAFVDRAAVDFDLLPLIISLQDSGDEYLFDHCVNVSLMGMAIASQLGLNREAIGEIGIAGLLQDIGMLRVPKEIRLSPGSLTAAEWKEIKLHPLHTLDMIAGLKGLPVSTRMVAYQAHERIDGSGYPRGRKDTQIHRFAQIVSIADTYSAMTATRPYRPALSPYETAKAILLAGKTNEFDRDLVRALLDTISLFPTGSLVGLSNGMRAQVLRAIPGRHTTPVVEEVTDDGYATGKVIDLSVQTEITIIRAF
ncbi:MAG: HD-GYP domain-containing protein [Planctomycetes bacterium]|nr:HD-GYP domain-containing protein [Planctomycetota bacterium]